MAYNTKTITTTATKILSQPANMARMGAIIQNTSSGAVYIGFDSNVTTSNGLELKEDATWETNEPRCFQGDVYGIVASGTSDVRYWELL